MKEKLHTKRFYTGIGSKRYPLGFICTGLHCTSIKRLTAFLLDKSYMKNIEGSEDETLLSGSPTAYTMHK